jgi:metal-dependent amidase/aminoacylase/carboxypeptidase family protein
MNAISPLHASRTLAAFSRSAAAWAAAGALVFSACADDAAAPPEPVIQLMTSTTARIEAELIALRRDLHQNPELSGLELRTAARIEEKLRALGLEVEGGVGGHGVVGVLRGALPGPVVAYRADMDAMPGDEPGGRDYGSLVPGVYHVCGHDAHSAIGIGVASVLSALKDRLPGTAVFLFQPAEETIEGAQAMLSAGALDALVPDAIYAVHSFPFPVGTIATHVDFGGLDQFEVTLAPELRDAAARAVSRLSALGTAARPGPGDVAPYLDQLLEPGGALDDAVYIDVETREREGRWSIEGSLRASLDSRYPELRAEITGILDAELGAGAYDLSFRPAPFPSMRSDRSVSDRAQPALRAIVGEGNVLTLQAMHLFSGEDFALFLQRAPGAMFLIGVANEERGILGAPHFPDFDLDEAAIPLATKAMSLVLWQRLAER